MKKLPYPSLIYHHHTPFVTRYETRLTSEHGILEEDEDRVNEEEEILFWDQKDVLQHKYEEAYHKYNQNNDNIPYRPSTNELVHHKAPPTTMTIHHSVSPVPPSKKL